MGMNSTIRTYLIKQIGKVSNKHCGDTWGTNCGTSAEFRSWEERAKALYPKLMFLCSIVEWVEDEAGYLWSNYWKRPYRYCVNRWWKKTHLIDCVGLERGRWLDPHDRILYGVMSECVRYIEGSDSDSIQRTVLDYVRLGVDGHLNDYDGKEATEWYLSMRESLMPFCEAYIWWTETWPTYSKRIESLYATFEAREDGSEDDCFLSDSRKAVYDKIYEIEKEQAEAEVENCTKVIKALPFLYD